jgi:hypothetical protein
MPKLGHRVCLLVLYLLPLVYLFAAGVEVLPSFSEHGCERKLLHVDRAPNSCTSLPSSFDLFDEIGDADGRHIRA